MIAVVGLGGGGCNTVSHLAERSALSEFFMFNVDTDATSAQKSSQVPFLLIGQRTCRGWGCGNSTEVGEMAIVESQSVFEEFLYGVTKLFLITSLGGGLGGAAHLLARQATGMGIEVVSFTTTPFSFEGKLKSHIAKESQKRLEKQVCSSVVFPNEDLLKNQKRPVSLQASLRFFDTLVESHIAEEKSTCCPRYLE